MYQENSWLAAYIYIYHVKSTVADILRKERGGKKKERKIDNAVIYS